MVTKAFHECLIDVYRGEVSGEAAFESMLGTADGVQQQYVMGSLVQFETEGKAIIRPLLMRLGLSMLEDSEGRAAGAAGGAQLGSLPWVERFAALRGLVEVNYLPRYLELGTLVSAEEDREAARIAAFMADARARHRRARNERHVGPRRSRRTRRRAATLSPASSRLIRPARVRLTETCGAATRRCRVRRRYRRRTPGHVRR